MPASAGKNTEDRLADLTAPGANQTGQSENLALMEREIDAGKQADLAEILDAQQFGANLGSFFGEELGDFPADHGHDQIVVGDLVDIPAADVLRVAENGDATGQPVHVLEAVRDEDDRDATVPEFQVMR